MEQQQEECTLKKNQLFTLTLTAMFCALIIALTFIPYTGYITIVGMLSITTIHVVVILGASLLGPVRGTILGAVWGVTCDLCVHERDGRRADFHGSPYLGCSPHPGGAGRRVVLPGIQPPVFPSAQRPQFRPRRDFHRHLRHPDQHRAGAVGHQPVRHRRR